jgi:hypothetical protein
MVVPRKKDGLGKRQADDRLFRSLLDPHVDTMILRCLARRPAAVQALASTARVCARIVVTRWIELTSA